MHVTTATGGVAPAGSGGSTPVRPRCYTRRHCAGGDPRQQDAVQERAPGGCQSTLHVLFLSDIHTCQQPGEEPTKSAAKTKTCHDQRQSLGGNSMRAATWNVDLLAARTRRTVARCTASKLKGA